MRNKLTDRSVRNAGVGKHGDGEGLQLVVRPTPGGELSRNWVLRFRSPAGRDREMGLGVYPLVGLQAAREARDDARRLLARGLDPLDERAAHREGQRAAETRARAAQALTFARVAEQVMDGQAFTNEKHRWQWSATLTAHAYPVIGAMPVDQVRTDDLVKIIEPILRKAPETARRLRGRLQTVLDFAIAHGWREGPNPARHVGHMERLLPALKKSERARQHYVALPHDQVPDFMRRLRAVDSTVAKCAIFTILTAARGGEARRAQWREIEWGAPGGPIWHVPPEHMKRRLAHDVPLPPQAVELLTAIGHGKPEDLIFRTPVGRREGQSITDMGLLRVVQTLWREIEREKQGQHAAPSTRERDADERKLTLHGFRSSFADWAHEQEVELGGGHRVKRFSDFEVEMALSHAVGDQTLRSYTRTQLGEMRRRLMSAWGAHCAGQALDSNVVTLRAA